MRDLCILKPRDVGGKFSCLKFCSKAIKKGFFAILEMKNVFIGVVESENICMLCISLDEKYDIHF